MDLMVFLVFKKVHDLKMDLTSGVEKLTRSSLKGVSNRALFLYKNGHFASSFLLLGIAVLEASKKANLSFKSPLSENPFRLDRVSFCTPNGLNL